MIIIEGPDGAGKTTLAKAIFKHYDKRHYGKDDEDKFGQYLRDIVGSPLRSLRDRMHYSEQAYGPVMRGVDILRPFHRMFDRVLLSRGGVLVLVLPPFEVCRENWAARLGDEYVQDEEKLAAIYSKYKYHLSSHLPTLIYDWTLQATPSNVEEMARQIAPPMNQGPGVGHFSERSILLIGERVSSERQLDCPFVLDSGCAPWLSMKLDEGRIWESNLYWANAERSNGDEEDPRYIDKLKPRTIIALGGKARAYCVKHGLEHEFFPHPQYWKRFKRNDPYPLIQRLVELGATRYA